MGRTIERELTIPEWAAGRQLGLPCGGTRSATVTGTGTGTGTGTASAAGGGGGSSSSRSSDRHSVEPCGAVACLTARKRASAFKRSKRVFLKEAGECP